jgi:hypothetical protein
MLSAKLERLIGEEELNAGGVLGILIEKGAISEKDVAAYIRKVGKEEDKEYEASLVPLSALTPKERKIIKRAAEIVKGNEVGSCGGGSMRPSPFRTLWEAVKRGRLDHDNFSWLSRVLDEPGRWSEKLVLLKAKCGARAWKSALKKAEKYEEKLYKLGWS